MSALDSRIVIISLVAASILLGAAGQLFMKVGMSQMQLEGFLGNWHLWFQPGVFWVIGGLSSYFGALVLWMIALTRLPLSIAYPLLSIGYVLVFLGAMAWLNEPFSWTRAVGTLLIVGGVILVTYQPKKVMS